ncbi:MAG: GTP 3',8-cyclase MoaA [Puniceicoccales bacterium]
MPFDGYQRSIHYLRISLTDVCNLRCVYCMPEQMAFRRPAELLSDAELFRVIPLFAKMGFDKFRFTGGEPTLRKSLVELIRRTASLPEVRQVGLTTNGLLLDQLARPLAEAGLTNVNVSLDTLDPARFREVTRWGNVRDVIEGLEAAGEAGLRVKINAVASRGINDATDVIELARFTLQHDWQVRFIELMPFGNNAEFQTGHIVREEELRQRLESEYGRLEPVNEGQLDGEAKVYRIPGAPGTLGFISPVSSPFCADCNRVRLTADGRLRLCLLRDDEGDLRELLRGGATDDELESFIRAAIHCKPWGHELKRSRIPVGRGMSEIGG